MSPLAVWTVLLSLTVAVGLFLFHFRRSGILRFLKDLVWLCIISVSLITSYNFLAGTEQMVITDKLTITLAPPLAFPVVVFLKILIGFWVYHMVYCIANSDRISETGLKIFGVEMTHKINLDLDQTAESYETLAWQLDFLDTMNTTFMNYFLNSFDYQIAQAADHPGALREALRNILVSLYYERFGPEEYEVWVVPLNDEGFEGVAPELVSMVKLNDTGDDNRIGAFSNIGISYHRFENDEYDTAIIIRTPEDYVLPRAEISSASMFFITMVKTVEYLPETSN